MKKLLIKRQICLPLPRYTMGRPLPTTSLTPEEIRVAQVVATAQQEMEIEMELFHGKYPVVERRY